MGGCLEATRCPTQARLLGLLLRALRGALRLHGLRDCRARGHLRRRRLGEPAAGVGLGLSGGRSGGARRVALRRRLAGVPAPRGRLRAGSAACGRVSSCCARRFSRHVSVSAGARLG